MRKIADTKIGFEDLMDTLDFVISYTLYHGMIDGKFERFNVIVD